MARNFKVCTQLPDPTIKEHYTTGTFADGHLTDALKNIANDANTDKRVKKKLIHVLASWHTQFNSDPSMTLVAGLYKQCRVDGMRMIGQQDLPETAGFSITPEEKRRIEKEEKRKEQQDKAAKPQDRQKRKRTPFDFEKVLFVKKKNLSWNRRLIHSLKEKSKILASIVDGSQASSNLVNAITVCTLLNLFDSARYTFPTASEPGKRQLGN